MMIGYSVIGTLTERIGSPASQGTMDAFPVDAEVRVIKSFNIDDGAQDLYFAVGRRGRVVGHEQDDIKVRFQTGAVLVFGDCIGDYLER